MEFEHAYSEACDARIALCKECKTSDDLMAVATSFAQQAGLIWEKLGGPKHAAAQLYAAADYMATKES